MTKALIRPAQHGIHHPCRNGWNKRSRPRRLITFLLGAFSSLALLLAAIGLYGVVAYSVTQRTREIGIRLAVGAQRGDVMNLIVGEGLKMAAAGVALGLVASLLMSHVLRSLLFGVTATDP